MQQNRFPFMFAWEGRLKAIVDRFVQAREAREGSENFREGNLNRETQLQTAKRGAVDTP
jgi:hypothetical protein